MISTASTDIGNQLITIQRQKQPNGKKPGSLVAIIKRMIAHDTEPVGCGKAGHICLWFVGMNMLRAGKRRIQCSRVAQAGEAAVFRQRLGMQ